MKFITLLGADDVQRAGGRMMSAAADMNRAASNIENSLYSHRIFLDDWLNRLEAIILRKTNKGD